MLPWSCFSWQNRAGYIGKKEPAFFSCKLRAQQRLRLVCPQLPTEHAALQLLLGSAPPNPSDTKAGWHRNRNTSLASNQHPGCPSKQIRGEPVVSSDTDKRYREEALNRSPKQSAASAARGLNRRGVPLTLPAARSQRRKEVTKPRLAADGKRRWRRARQWNYEPLREKVVGRVDRAVMVRWLFRSPAAKGRKAPHSSKQEVRVFAGAPGVITVNFLSVFSTSVDFEQTDALRIQKVQRTSPGIKKKKKSNPKNQTHPTYWNQSNQMWHQLFHMVTSTLKGTLDRDPKKYARVTSNKFQTLTTARTNPSDRPCLITCLPREKHSANFYFCKREKRNETLVWFSVSIPTSLYPRGRKKEKENYGKN